jgi:ArsR family transcriptional regulator
MAASIGVEPSSVDTENATELFAALADPARMRILAALADAGRFVCDIRGVVPIAANLLSYHLRVLRQAGLVEGNRRGRWVDYRVADGAATLIADAIRSAGFPATVEQPAGWTSACEVPPS